MRQFTRIDSHQNLDRDHICAYNNKVARLRTAQPGNCRGPFIPTPNWGFDYKRSK